MSHLSRHRTKILAGAVIAASGAASTQAAPLVVTKLLGWNISKGQTIADANQTITDLAVGNSIGYEILTFLADVGTTNTNGGLITSKTTPTASGAGDGINSLTMDAFELTSQQIQGDFKLSLGALYPLFAVNTYNSFYTTKAGKQYYWKKGTGASGGILAARGNGNNDIITIRPVTTAGLFFAGNSTLPAAVIGTGFFNVASTGTGALSTLSVKYRPGGGGGSYKINGGATQFINDGTEASLDPVMGFTPLTLVIPEPGSLSLLGLAAAGLLVRRKEKKA